MYLTTSHPNSNHSILVLIANPQVWTGLRKSLYLRSRILKSCPQVLQCNCQATSGWIKLCLVFIFFWSADPSNTNQSKHLNGMLWTQNKHVEDCPSLDIPAFHCCESLRAVQVPDASGSEEAVLLAGKKLLKCLSMSSGNPTNRPSNASHWPKMPFLLEVSATEYLMHRKRGSSSGRAWQAALLIRNWHHYRCLYKWSDTHSRTDLTLAESSGNRWKRSEWSRFLWLDCGNEGDQSHMSFTQICRKQIDSREAELEEKDIYIYI